MSIAFAEEMINDMDSVETDAEDALLSTGIAGEFAPLDEFNVSFAVRTTPIAVFPPEWVVHGSIRYAGADTLPIAIFNLGPENRTHTVKIVGLPGEYSGTMELMLIDGKSPCFTVKYTLKQSRKIPTTRKGTYVFYWSV